MGGNTIGELFRVTTFGESHGEAIGAVIDGCPPGIELSIEEIQDELDKRRPGSSAISSERQELDRIEIISGEFEGKTTGTPICMLIKNKDSDSLPYESIKNVFRPGHADYTYHMKYGIRDYRGGGRSSGRETASRVAAGAIAKKLIKIEGIEIFAYTKQVGKIKAKTIDLSEIWNNPVRCPDKAAAEKMELFISNVKKKGDSVGGIVECVIRNVPIGLGEPVFDKLDSDLAKAVMSIGGTKGIEFGKGFESPKMKGSQNNDEMYVDGGKAMFKSNNAGGILGGISTGQDIIFRVAVKPTPSIKKEQMTINENMQEVFLNIKGRHDPCICPRIVPVISSMAAIVIADHMLRQKAIERGA